MGIDWGHGPKPDDDDEGEEFLFTPIESPYGPPPMHPNCRCSLELVVLDWWKRKISLEGAPDWAAAGYNWPSVGDLDELEDVKALGETILVASKTLADDEEAFAAKKAIADKVNTLELEKLLELRGELRQLRRDRWIWFAWGAGLSPWLAMLLKWLAGS